MECGRCGSTRDHGPMAPLDGNPGDGVSAEGASRGRISARIAAVAESATLAIDGKAKALKAAGEDVVGFGVGEPDFADARRISSKRPSTPVATRRTTGTRPPPGYLN